MLSYGATSEGRNRPFSRHQVVNLAFLVEPEIRLIGPGDSGKSTVLDAIDLCLGARRSVQFTDADFHGRAVRQSIRITITIGALDMR